MIHCLPYILQNSLVRVPCKTAHHFLPFEYVFCLSQLLLSVSSSFSHLTYFIRMNDTSSAVFMYKPVFILCMDGNDNPWIDLVDQHSYIVYICMSACMNWANMNPQLRNLIQKPLHFRLLFIPLLHGINQNTSIQRRFFIKLFR